MYNENVVLYLFNKKKQYQKQKNMKKYKQNLRVENNKVISYTTHVATIENNDLIQLGWWSVTTQKHINYVAKEFNLNLVKN